MTIRSVSNKTKTHKYVIAYNEYERKHFVIKVKYENYNPKLKHIDEDMVIQEYKFSEIDQIRDDLSHSKYLRLQRGIFTLI